jgi:hypothetical protein
MPILLLICSVKFYGCNCNLLKIIPSFSKAVANRQLYQPLHTNTKHRSLNVYVTLTFQRHKTQSANCSIAKHKSRVIITNISNTATNNRTFKKYRRIYLELSLNLSNRVLYNTKLFTVPFSNKMALCCNTADVMLTVCIGLCFHSYFYLNCSTKPFIYSIIFNVL